jgi:hypothetical protein
MINKNARIFDRHEVFILESYGLDQPPFYDDVLSIYNVGVHAPASFLV